MTMQSTSTTPENLLYSKSNNSSMDSTFVQVIQNDQVGLFIEQLIHCKLNINQSIEFHGVTQPILFVVILCGANQILKYLLEEFHPSQVGGGPVININCTNAIQSNALHIAACSNNIEAAMTLLQNSKFSKKNERDVYGNHAIHIAARQNSYDFVNYLVTVGKIDVNLKKTQSGKTALHVAMEENLPEMVSLLLDTLYANYNSRDNENMPPILRLACSAKTHYSSRFLCEMVCRDVDFACSAKDHNKQNIIHKCVIHGNIKLLRIIALALPGEKYSLLVNEQDAKYRYTPLHYACQYINPAVVDLLLLMGANGLLTDIKGNTPFHLIARTYEERRSNIEAFRISKALFDSEIGNQALKLKNQNNQSVEQILQKAEFFEDYICRRSTC